MSAANDSSSPSLEEVRERYRIEREKRLRDDGLDQFQEFKGELADFDHDPYADADFTRDPIAEDVDVVIVGGGFGGMHMAINLKSRGIDSIRIVEKGGDFGGTWYWNRYPGCQCDVESFTYLPFLEETGYMPTERYARAPEIFEHCQRIGRHFGLYQHALFQTEIDTPIWDDDRKRWMVTTSRGDRLSARYFVTAGGILHKAKLPGIPGIADFDGIAFHTSRWDYSVTGGGPTEPMDKLADKRVGIIGTGATGVQAVPQLAAAAKDVYVFQRTPAAVGIRGNRPTDAAWFNNLEPGWQDQRMRNFTQAVTGEMPDVDMVDDGWTSTLWVDTQMAADSDERNAELEHIDFEVMQALRDRVDQVIDDPELAERLKAWYGKHCKRITFHDEYLAAFNEPNVHLVDTEGRGVEKITKTGAVVNGVEYPLDVLIFASGFEVTTGLVQRLGFDPIGRDGVALSERWADGAHTLHGILTAEFPNMMVVSTVQAGFGTNFVHFLSESTKHVAWLIAECEARGVETIEARPEAEDAWLYRLWGIAAGMATYSAACTPSYYNSEGKPTDEGARNVVYPGSLLHYIGCLDEWREAGNFDGARVEYQTD